MSFVRLIYWSALIGGWAAFLAWLITELIFGRYIDRPTVHDAVRFILGILMASLVAVSIGGGVSMASGLTNPKLSNLFKRLLVGFIGGLIGGLIGSLLGGCIFAVLQNVPVLGFLSRVFGWTLIGLGIGVAEGIFEWDMKKLRNGAIGGTLGGFLAGFFFVPVDWIIGSPMSSRAFAFVLLGVFIGLFIGLAQVLLKETWLTVEQGFRAGRQLILGQDQITMGTSEKASMIFIAYGAKGVEPIHLKISKQENGGFLLEDNQSRTGTLLNGQPVSAPTFLADGDTIQFGVNVIRFNERVKHGEGDRLPPPVIKPPAPVPAIPSEAIQANAPPARPTSSPAIQPARPPMPPPAAIQPPPTPAPQPIPAAAPKPAAPAQPQEGRCPICDRRITGIPGERRCGKCFTTF